MPAWISCNMHKPVVAGEELVPHLQGLSNAMTTIFFVVKMSRLYTDERSPAGLGPRIHHSSHISITFSCGCFGFFHVNIPQLVKNIHAPVCTGISEFLC